MVPEWLTATCRQPSPEDPGISVPCHSGLRDGETPGVPPLWLPFCIRTLVLAPLTLPLCNSTFRKWSSVSMACPWLMLMN